MIYDMIRFLESPTSNYDYGSNGAYIQYNTTAGPVEDKINVHLVPHSHDDVGWLKTVDQYYIGSNNSIQGACVKNVLDSLVLALQEDPNRKFIFAEQAFFQRWWREQSDEKQTQVKKLVDAGQLEFINGGWCMHDEATVHYIDMIDQTTLGHRFIKQQFNKTPRVGWQIDPFGHSAVQAYLLGAELGFDSLFFARIDYQDRAKRKDQKSLEVVWRGSKTFGSSSQIFAGAFPVHYSPPPGFHFEVNDDDDPIQDDVLLFDYNVDQRVNDFVDASITQANITRTNHIMWTMGDDFQYQYANSWFTQMDKFIHYVNKDGRVNAFYSTPSIYTDAKNAANEAWPLKVDDYFPYADSENAYWTGYFTSRPGLKGYVRYLSGYYLAARQLEFLVGRKSGSSNTDLLGDALGIAQHHDAVSGTEKQHTANDYAKRLAIGASQAEEVVSLALSCLTSSETSGCPNISRFEQCGSLNISICPPTQTDLPLGKILVVLIYNPLGWKREQIIKVPVNNESLTVKDSDGNTVLSQLVPLENSTVNLTNYFKKENQSISLDKSPLFSLFFQVSVPPLGFSTYIISKDNGTRPVLSTKQTAAVNETTYEAGPGNFRMTFSSISGQLQRISNSRTGVNVPVQQSYLWYGSSNGDASDSQASGAYIFRPNGAPPTAILEPVPLTIMTGPLVHEIHQKFNSWIYQVTRLYKDKEHAEVEFTIGPIPVDDGVGKEVITRMTANMATNKVFYTDSNGRDFIKRVRDYRTDWDLQVHQPVAGNYYPINLGMYMADNKIEFSVLVDRAVGGSSIQDGQLEIMFHRRLINDDGRGVGEALDETVCEVECEGLTVRGTYYVSINAIGNGAQWRRTTGQEIYSPLLLAFSQEEAQNWDASHSRFTAMDLNYSLPNNVAIPTLQELEDGSVLLRLAHLYEAGEDSLYSQVAKVELKKVFSTKTVLKIKEMNLSANQEKSEMKKLNWTVIGDNTTEVGSVRGGPVDDRDMIVELGPMEIRTFILQF
ncbi:alpha-mannosidase [Cryptomeria japonica]|uniref:alpha-mannosidase n=1 Tax=Cryptomeria japonica TaxID=3369 RepID=UPI0027DA10DC|nr:alpha-mannosidase [Cryptomeria japonica]